MRKVVVMVEIDDGLAVKEDLGTIEYLEREFGWLEKSGVFLRNARILDDDDKEDETAIELASKIFEA